MENNLLYCYKDWLEKEEGTLFKKIFKIPIKTRVLLTLLIIVLVAFLVFGFLSNEGNNYTIVEVVLACVYIILCVVVSIDTERQLRKNSEDDLESYRSYCIKLKKYLIEDRKMSLNLFPDLIARLNTMNDKIEEKIERKHEQFNRFMEMLLIPISAVILGALLDKDISVTEVLDFGLAGVVIILGIYGTILFVLLFLDAVMRVPQGRYRRFATDMQSILDFEQCKNYTKSNATVTTSTSTEIPPKDEEPQSLTIR